MLKSIYTPLSGAVTQERVMDMIANNLANMNTHGFKGDKFSFELLRAEPEKHYNNPLPPANYKMGYQDLSPLVGNEIEHVGLSDVRKDMTQGPAIQTNNQTDVMLEGRGFFTVHTRDGERLTRNGALSINQEGTLTTKTGDPILGTQGTVQLSPGKFTINQRGEIYQNGEYIDRLLVKDAADRQALERVGQNYFLHNGPEENLKVMDFPGVKQGSLEGSNVNAIKNLTAMILAHRSVEAYQKALKNYDLMMDKSVNRIGDARA